MDVVKKIETTPTGPNNRPLTPVIISECGELPVEPADNE
jgi:hypothetical protein